MYLLKNLEHLAYRVSQSLNLLITILGAIQHAPLSSVFSANQQVFPCIAVNNDLNKELKVAVACLSKGQRTFLISPSMFYTTIDDLCHDAHSK